MLLWEEFKLKRERGYRGWWIVIKECYCFVIKVWYAQRRMKNEFLLIQLWKIGLEVVNDHFDLLDIMQDSTALRTLRLSYLCKETQQIEHHSRVCEMKSYWRHKDRLLVENDYWRHKDRLLVEKDYWRHKASLLVEKITKGLDDDIDTFVWERRISYLRLCKKD